MIHGLHIKDGKATYVSRYVRTSRMKQEEFFGGAKFMKIGDLKGLFGLLTVNLQMLRAKLKVLDMSYGNGTANTALIYHHGKLLALSEADKPYVLRVLEDGDLQTLGLLDYDKRLTHSFTAHPKVDPITGEMFTFGYSHSPPYITYRVISKDGFMHDPVPITIPAPIMMHDFAITENYALIMDLPLYFRPKEMVKEKKIIFTFDSTKKARFGVLPRYAKNESLIKWFELPNCFIFHNANAWEEGDEVVLITCRIENPDLDMVSGAAKDMVDSFSNQLYEMRFNMKTGLASQRKLSAPAVDFPRVNENFTGSKSSVNVIDAKTMSPEPVAVVELPSRVPYGFHAFFVTEEQLKDQVAF
ncbi:Carotenoid 9 10(9' 10')-cleavage dioxygenase 1 [Bienertia sinuspersici]